MRMKGEFKVKNLVKFCICVVFVCAICIINGCYSTNTAPPTSSVISNNQSNDIRVENVYLSEKQENSDILIPVSSNDEKEFEISEKKGKRGIKVIRILKDNKYGNEYIIVADGNGLGICLRKRD